MQKLKKSLVISLIIMLIYSTSFYSFAALDFATSEAPGRTVPVDIPDTPSDGPGSYEPDPPSGGESHEASINIVVPTSLEGTIYEDQVKYVEIPGEITTTTRISNDGKYNSGEPLISGVEVLNNASYNASTNELNGSSIAVTGNNGKFSISTPGAYNLSFKYGYNIGESNYRLNKDSLKYNGQDYSMHINADGTVMTAELKYMQKINELKKSYTEIMILIDFSNSMNLESEGVKKIDIVKESAINFVNQLFAEAEGNIAVGFMAFAYEGCIVKAPTDVQSDVIEGINNFEVDYATVREGYGYYSGTIAPMWSSLNHETGTNIGGAVEKAKEKAFLGAESNKVIVLFSDGAATAHKNLTERIYNNDSEAMIRAKLDTVAAETKADLKDIVDSGITLISILNKTEDPDEIEYINKAFKEGGSTIGILHTVGFDDRAAVEEALVNDVKTEIEKNLGFEAIASDEDINPAEGNDDIARRTVLTNYYKDLDYSKLKIFSLIDNLNGTSLHDRLQTAKYLDIEDNTQASYKKFITSSGDNHEIENFVENTWMLANSGQTIKLYKIVYDGDGKYDKVVCGSEVLYDLDFFIDIDDSDPENPIEIPSYSVNGAVYKEENVSITGTTIKMQCGLTERSEFQLELEKKITGVRLTLSDGTVIYQKVANAVSGTDILDLNKMLQEHNSQIRETYKQTLQQEAGIISEVSEETKKNWTIKEVEEYVPGTVTLTADTEVLQGATLEVEYTLVVTNNSNIFSKEVSIVDYYNNGLIYRDDSKMISEDATNKDYGWGIVSTKELYNNGKINKDAKANEVKCLYVNYTEDGYKNAENIPNNGNIASTKVQSKYMNPRIGAGGSRHTKVVLSVVLSAELIEEFKYENQAEIVEYTSSISRRMNYTEEGPVVGSLKYERPIAGNYVPRKMLEVIDVALSNVGEIDTAIGSPISIIPPTGKTNSNYERIFGSIILISLLGCYGIQLMKKY